MKKLLALLLCVMLFVSVIPTAAFADAAPSGISLWPIVKQANHFYGALQQYDGLTKIAGLAKGFPEAFPKLFEINPYLSFGMVELAYFFYMYASPDNFDPATGKFIPPYYEELGISLNEALLNVFIAELWVELGNTYVGDYQGTAGDGTLTGAIAAQESNIPTVTFPA